MNLWNKLRIASRDRWFDEDPTQPSAIGDLDGDGTFNTPGEGNSLRTKPWTTFDEYSATGSYQALMDARPAAHIKALILVATTFLVIGLAIGASLYSATHPIPAAVDHSECECPPK